MNIVTLDFETYYDQDYSLSKMTTEEYVRSPLFEVIGVSVKIDEGPATWYVDPVEAFKGIDWSKVACLAHNAAFDGAILTWRYGHKPKLWLDTLSMARPHHALTCGCSLASLVQEYRLGEKGFEVQVAKGKRKVDFTPQEMSAYASYCIKDAELCYRLFDKLVDKTPPRELKIIDMTIRMFTEPGFELDKSILEEHLSEVRSKKANLLASLGEGGSKDMLMSNPQFAKALQDLGVDPPMKVSKTTNKVTYAFAKTDQGLLALQEHHDPRVQTLVAARLGVKSTIEETRTEAFIGIADRGKLPIMLNYWKAHTGRFSGGDGVNPQNLPRGGTLRRSMLAPAGKYVVGADLSQIEARVIAWLAGQDDLVQAFRDERDVYCEFASEAYDRPITKADTTERFVGKTCTLGLGYGMGPVRLRETLAIGSGGMRVIIDEIEAKRLVQIYRTKNHRIKTFWDECRNALNIMVSGGEYLLGPGGLIRCSGETVYLPDGTQLHYPGLHRDEDGVLHYYNRKKKCKIYGGLFAENLTQSLARAVIEDAMVGISAHYRPLLQVHDEIIFLVAQSKLDEAKARLELVMRTPPQWGLDLPVNCEVKHGKSYGECK